MGAFGSVPLFLLIRHACMGLDGLRVRPLHADAAIGDPIPGPIRFRLQVDHMARDENLHLSAHAPDRHNKARPHKTEYVHLSHAQDMRRALYAM